MIRRAILAIALIAGIAPAIAQVPAPVPALPDTERRTAFTITASTCACNIGFALYGDSTDFQNWVEVYLNGVRVNYNDATFGWTITSPSGSLANLARPITNAVLTFTNAQTGVVQIVGARRPRRVSQYQENNGVPTRNFNRDLTDIIAQNRELWDKTNDMTGRGLFFAPGNTVGPMPSPSACAGGFLGFDATGLNPLCLAGGAGSGNVVGPASSTAGDFALFNSATGTLLQDAPSTVIQSAAANKVWAGPASGANAAPGFRSLGLADLPLIPNSGLAQMLPDTVKCNPTGSTANAQDCTNPVIAGLTVNAGASNFGGITLEGTSNPLLSFANGITNEAIICLSTGTSQCLSGDAANDLVIKNIASRIILSADNLPDLIINSGTGRTSVFSLSVNVPSSGRNSDALDITPSSSPMVRGLNIGSDAGYAITGAGPPGGNLNLINITSDNAVMSGSAFSNALGVNYIFGGSAMTGGRQAFQAEASLNGASSSSNGNRNYVAGTFVGTAMTGDGGTDLGAGVKGAMFGLNAVAHSLAGATNLLNVAGMEIDVDAQTGSTVSVKAGLQIALLGTDAVHGSSFDAAIMIGSQGTGTWNNALIFGAINGGFPFNATSTIIASVGTGTVGSFMDFSSFACSANVLKTANVTLACSGVSTFAGSPGATASPIVNIVNTHQTIGDFGIQLAVGVATDSSSLLMRFTDAVTFATQGSITRNGAGAVLYNTTSDERLKIDHGTGSKGLDDLMAIKVHDFAMKADPDILQEGYFAQELYQVYPDAVHVGGEDPAVQPWAVDYGRLTPLIVKSIQDMQHEIDDLRAARN